MSNHTEVIAISNRFKEAVDLARRVADSCANVLILGESGTGKEVIAQMIHNLSKRRGHAFVPINCSAIPENLLESELFGYAKGAFTGAAHNKAGLFEEAEGGTLFLDEIADLDFGIQAKLLRVIQERKIKRVGENSYRPVNIRIICATHQNLHEAIQQKTFREDLFFRLNVISILVPPLRERREDILPLAEYFLKKYSSANGKEIHSFDVSAKEALMSYQWPGNVRELENLVERAVVLALGWEVRQEDLKILVQENGGVEESSSGLQRFFSQSLNHNKLLPIEEVTRLYIQYALEVNKGAKDKTARDLGIDRKTLYRRLRAASEPSDNRS